MDNNAEWPRKGQRLWPLSVLFLIAFAAPAHASHVAATGNEEAICSRPDVILCDNFEDRAMGTAVSAHLYKHNGWGSTQSAGRAIEAGTGLGNTKAFRYRYPVAPPNDPHGPGYNVAWFTPGTKPRTIYARWYTKWSSDYKLSSVADKHVNLGPTNSEMVNAFFTWFSNPKFAFGLHVERERGGLGSIYPNVASVPWAANTWFCFETRVTISSAYSVPDGYLQAWVNGVKTHEFPNIIYDGMRNPPPTGFDFFMFSAYWNCHIDPCDPENDPLEAHPEMERWHDNVIVSTQPIGCLGTPPPAPPSEPNPPTGLIVR